ncbi:MAG: hypothetical protein RL417_1133 [Pseudomonadota bacterium]|jgi:hypothetical protein
MPRDAALNLLTSRIPEVYSVSGATLRPPLYGGIDLSESRSG